MPDQYNYPSHPADFSLDDFFALVQHEAGQLPADIQDLLANVAITVAVRPSAEQKAAAGLGPNQALYGLYQGVPHTHRGQGYGLVPPDRITLFMVPMIYHFTTLEELRRQVRRTMLHEIGHHFGLGEQRLRELGY